jgi:hypothetical protein
VKNDELTSFYDFLFNPLFRYKVNVKNIILQPFPQESENGEVELSIQISLWCFKFLGMRGQTQEKKICYQFQEINCLDFSSLCFSVGYSLYF